MKCKVVNYLVPANDTFNAGISPTKGYVRCETHGLDNLAPYSYEGMLCPIGRIEKATEEGIKEIEDSVKRAMEYAIEVATKLEEKHK